MHDSDVKDEDRALAATAFDAEFYLARNPDVAEAGMDALEHFLSGGWRENRDPSRKFSIASYLDLNEDVARSGVNPLLHYLAFGRAENRLVRLDLGFRYDVLRNAPTLEARLETGRPHDIAGEPMEGLAAAFALLGQSLFITVSHDAYVDSVGGVQLCLKREAAALVEGGWSHLHLYPAVPSPVSDFETLDPVMGVVIDGQTCGLFEASKIATAILAVQKAQPFKTLGFAIHSLLGHSIPSVSTVLASAGAKAGFLWLHDQASLCASYTLLRNDVAFCGAPAIDSQACSICVYGLRRRVQVADHMAFFEQFAVTVLAPSQAQLDLWLASSAYPAAAVHVHPHAVMNPRSGTAVLAPDGPLRVAFLGFPANHKGWPIFAALAAQFADDPRYHFLHLGKQGDEPPAIDFIAVDPPNDIGDQMTNAMVQAVEAAGVDVALILSICPETFCFTAHEAVAAGAAVVAFADSGAVARFAAQPGRGQVISSEPELTALFATGEIIALSRAARNPPLFDLHYSQMTADFIDLTVGAIP